MCILFIAVNQHSDYPLVIAANRDEFHQRPTQSSHWWEDLPNILAGRDLQAGGTWMGITKSGKFAALTNIRDPKRINENAKSRGELVVNGLLKNTDNYHTSLAQSKSEYNGYNILYGDIHNLKVYNNFEDSLQTLTTGVYGLSNAALNSPWPKTTKGMQALSDYCQSAKDIETDALFTLLRDDVKAPDHELPDTGVPYDWEKQLSSAFIVTPEYGTRCSTVLLVAENGECHWQERAFDSNANIIGEREYSFTIERP
jgi:uncharacterized protein with NRDE domain